MTGFNDLRRGVLLLASCATLFASFSAEAAGFPTKPIELVVPYPPGASTDLIARVLQRKMGEFLGQSIVVENKAGAGGNIGVAYVAKSTPDGYRLVLSTNATVTINPHVYSKPGFDALKDLTAVAAVANGPLCISVNAKLGVNSLQELIALAKQGKHLSFGSAGNGSPQHLVGELLNKEAGISLTHVPYRGIGPALTDLLGGTIQVMVSTLASVKPSLQNGSLKVLAIAEEERFAGAPTIPTVAETFPGFDASAWFGIYAPTGTPKDVVDKVNAAVNAALADPAVKQTLLDNALIPAGGAAAMLTGMTQADYRKWGEVVRSRGISAD